MLDEIREKIEAEIARLTHELQRELRAALQHHDRAGRQQRYREQ